MKLVLMLLALAKPAVAQEWNEIAIAEVKQTYGDVVSIDRKNKSILKFGHTRNADSGVETLIAHMLDAAPLETYVSANTIAYISSSNNSDTSTINYEGHTYDSATGDFKFITASVTLQGQTKVTLPTAVARVSRGYNSGSTSLLGNVYWYEDDTVVSGVPQTASKTHLIIEAGENQTEKAATTVSFNDYLFITSAYVGLARGGASVNADLYVEVRLPNGVFRPLYQGVVFGGSNSHPFQFRPYLIVPKNSDIRMTVVSNAANAEAMGWFQGMFATVVTRSTALENPAGFVVASAGQSLIDAWGWLLAPFLQPQRSSEPL